MNGCPVPGSRSGALNVRLWVVAAAYGWPAEIGTDEALERLLALNLERAAAGSAPMVARAAE